MNAASSESNGGAGSGRWERSAPPSAMAPASRRPSRRSGCEANGPARPCRRASPSVRVLAAGLNLEHVRPADRGFSYQPFVRFREALGYDKKTAPAASGFAKSGFPGG